MSIIKKKQLFGARTSLLLILTVLVLWLLCGSGSAYEVPLRVQVDNSCATTSLAMVMDTWNESRSQQFWDACAKRKPDSATYYDDLYMCAWNMGYEFRLLDSYYARDLQAKDLVIYHVLGYDNSSDLHSSVIERVNKTNKSLVIANPWGSYDFYTFKEFESVFAGKGIRIKSRRTSRDESFIAEIAERINETALPAPAMAEYDICIKQ